jgi:hypothetical protein
MTKAKRTALVVGLVLLAAGFLLGRASEGGDEVATVTLPVRGEGFAVLSTHRCPTDLAVGQSSVHVAHRLTVPLPGGSSDEVAVYASSVGSVLVGPRGWKCRATMGADGSQQIGLAPPGSERAAWFAREGDPAVLRTIVPACAGCIASMICAFFPEEEVVQAYAQYEECPPLPSGEDVSYVSGATAVFVDPPNVKGTGLGSGGSLSSLGAVAYLGKEQGARQISCTLPPELADLCPGIVGATLAIGG